jgi:DNA-binding CsgD family transcriptional regulator
MRAYVAAHAGRVADAREAAAESMALAAESGWQVAAFWASVALGHLELALGNDALVVETLARSIALVERDGIGELSRRPFLPDAIEALIRLGDLDRAERLTDQLEQQGHALARSCAIVAGARCRAVLLAARGDIGEALEHVERALHDRPTIPIPLELARTLIVKGQLERRRKQRGAAASSFRRAIAICDDIGAELWAMRARSELARTGAVRSDAELTPSEERVAQLAAAGMANREIAAAVFMSQKTVEANLSRVYRKLGIRSRAELGVRLAAMQSASSEPGGG